MKVIVVFEIIVSIAVTVSFAIVQGDQEACPKVCSRCSPEHRHLNGTVLNLIHAFCKWKSGNKLTDVPSTLPSNLGVLLLTSHNIQLLRKTSLRPFGLLHQLYFDKNRLQRIENGSFSQQRYLKELDLKDNELTNIGRETFQGLVSLEILRLDHNKISHISRGTFEFTSSIKYIDLQNNNLQTLDESAFDRLDHLEKLLLNYNLLNAIDRGHFGNLMSLSRLELGFNQIGKVDSEAFSCAPLIKNLVINKNKLKAIPVGSIHHLGVLESLELSGNPINFVESSALVGLENLKVLDLSRCNISFIQRGAFNDLKMVKTIHLQQNPLDCDCHMTWLRRWLSWKPDVTLLGAVCVYPSGVSNQSFTVANLSSFICTCETCFKDALCLQRQMKNCSCFGNWTGQSCHGICHLSNTTGSACRYMGGKCLCENESVPLAQNQNVRNCSFNMTSQKCSENGKIQKVGSHLDCVCSDGFTGDGINCTDIDECEAEHKSCTSEHAGCVNTLGSYHCACHEGFKDANPGLPPGITPCVDIDECNEISKTCHENAACNNVPGSYICSCLPGYTGSGKICYPVPKEPTALTVTETGSGTVSVTWGISNTSTITRFTVEYKALGIHGPDWERVVVINDPPRDKLVVNLTNLVPGSTYVLRVGVFTIYNNSVYSKEQLFAAAALSQVPNTEQTTEGTSHKVKSALLALGLVVAVVVLVVISIGIHRFVRKKKKGNRNSNPQYAPGLEDLIEMRAHSQSGREVAERLASDFFEHGSTVSHPSDLTNQWEVPRDKLVIGQKIGEGQFGLVLEGTLLTDDGPMKVAVKTLKEPVHRFDYRDLIQEMEMMKEIGHHPHVISLLGTCTTPGPLYIITEFVSGGNLLDYLRSSRPSDETYVNIISTLSSRDLLKIALDVARGMNHIAKKKFVHRDLAARNVLLTEDFEAKVADFGLTRDIYGDGQYVKTRGGRVPIKWMAPESIQDQIYTTKSDVWAFGVLLWEIVTIGSSPYPCVPVSLLLSKLLCGYRMSKPAHCSDELHDLMKMCWELDPEARPTFSEICESLSDMLSESARSYVNITVSDERLAREPNVMDDGQQQSTAV